MKKFSFAFSMIFVFIFTGCTSYSITKYFDKDEFYNKAIQFTKKSDIKEDGLVLAMMNVTYLNSVSKDFDNDKENFIIGIYFEKDEKNQGLNHPDFVLLMNDKEPLSIEKLSNDNEIQNNIPLKNHWAQYYLVSFEKDEVNLFEEENHDLIVSFENKASREIYLKQKEKEEQANQMLSLLDEIPETTLTQEKKASVTFLKEL